MDRGRKLGQYELLEVTGQGEMLTLYRARSADLERPVTLKLVHAQVQDDPDLVSRFRRRAEELDDAFAARSAKRSSAMKTPASELSRTYSTSSAWKCQLIGTTSMPACAQAERIS